MKSTRESFPLCKSALEVQHPTARRDEERTSGRKARTIGAIASFALAALAAGHATAAVIAVVPNQGNGSASVIDTASQTQTSVIAGLGTAYSAAVAPNGSVAYVTDFVGSRVFPINTTTHAVGTAIPVGSSPVNVTFSSDSAFAYVSNYGANSISVVDVASGTVAATVANVCPAGATSPIQSIFNGAQLLIVCNGAASKVVSMNTAGGNALTTLATVGSTAYNIAISTASGFGYVSNYGGADISKFDLTTGATTNYPTTGVNNPLGLAVTPDGSKIYVGDYGGTNLIVMGSTGVISSTLDLGVNIAGIGMSSNGSVIYVPLRGMGAGIKVIDTATDAVTNTIANPGANPQVIWGDFLGNVAAPAAPNAAPTASGVAITGTASVGALLTGSYTYADAESDPQGVSTFQWYSDTVSTGASKVAIAGAMATTYSVQAGDAGKYLFHCVTPVASAGTLTGVETCSGATSAVSAAVTTYTAPSATGSGSITASFAGGGPACTYTVSQFIPLTGNAASPPSGTAPAGISFPHGLFDFTTGGCAPGSTITMTITYPQALRAGTAYWKYGPTPTDASYHWYVLPATLVGNTATFSITDGGLGDDDLLANGTIVDQGGPGAGAGAGAGPNAIPTLAQWGMMILASLMALVALVTLRRRGL